MEEVALPVLLLNPTQALLLVDESNMPCCRAVPPNFRRAVLFLSRTARRTTKRRASVSFIGSDASETEGTNIDLTFASTRMFYAKAARKLELGSGGGGGAWLCRPLPVSPSVRKVKHADWQARGQVRPCIQLLCTIFIVLAWHMFSRFQQHVGCPD